MILPVLLGWTSRLQFSLSVAKTASISAPCRVLLLHGACSLRPLLSAATYAINLHYSTDVCPAGGVLTTRQQQQNQQQQQQLLCPQYPPAGSQHAKDHHGTKQVQQHSSSRSQLAYCPPPGWCLGQQQQSAQEQQLGHVFISTSLHPFGEPCESHSGANCSLEGFDCGQEW